MSSSDIGHCWWGPLHDCHGLMWMDPMTDVMILTMMVHLMMDLITEDVAS